MNKVVFFRLQKCNENPSYNQMKNVNKREIKNYPASLFVHETSTYIAVLVFF